MDVALRAGVIESLAGEFVESFDASLQMALSPRDPMAEYLRGEISSRQLRVLGDGLALDSPFVRAVEGHSWRDETWLLHDISTTMRVLHALVFNFAGGKPEAKPKALPTPLDGQLTVASAAEKEYEQKQRAEMDKYVVGRIFADPKRK